MCRSGRRRRIPLHLPLVLALAFSSPPADAKNGLVIQLRFVPTDAEEVLEKQGVLSGAGPRFEIIPATDGRAGTHNPALDLIGENREDPIPGRILTTSNVPGWITQTLTDTLRDWGAPSTPNAPLVLHTEIMKLFVVETDTYQAEVSLRFGLKRRNGSEIWTGVVVGAASRFGRSQTPDNYQEVLSDAVLSSYSKLWTDSSFRDAWSGKQERQPEQGTGAAARPSPVEKLSPEVTMKKLLDLKAADFEDEALIAWLNRIELERPLTAEDMIAWKKAGVSQAVIRAAMR